MKHFMEMLMLQEDLAGFAISLSMRLAALLNEFRLIHMHVWYKNIKIPMGCTSASSAACLQPRMSRLTTIWAHETRLNTVMYLMHMWKQPLKKSCYQRKTSRKRAEYRTLSSYYNTAVHYKYLAVISLQVERFEKPRIHVGLSLHLCLG